MSVDSLVLGLALLAATSTSEVESRLLAPCCLKQTLESHQSPLASQLRAEIRSRLAQGESGAAIERDLVLRYGDRIRAVPAGFSVDKMGAWMFAGVFLFGLVWFARWFVVLKRRPRSAAPTATQLDSVWEQRLDDELEKLL